MHRDVTALATVVIPTYNRMDSLENVIESVKSQTFNNWRIFVSDDCSTDNTTAVVNNIIKINNNYPITYWRNAKNLKEYMNVNQALSKCYGTKYVAVLQDDSRYIDHTFLESAINLMERYDDITFVAGHFKNSRGITKLWNDNLVCEGKQFWHNWPNVWCFWPACVFRYDTLAEIGFIDTSMGAYGDSLMLLKMALKGKVGLLNQIVLEDGYNKKFSAYTDFYRNVKACDWESRKYFSNAADFAMMMGAERHVAEDWFTRRYAGNVYDTLISIINGKNDRVKNLDILLNEIQTRDPEIMKLLLKHVINNQK